MDSVAFYSRCPWIVRSQVRFDIQRDVLVHVDVDHLFIADARAEG